MLAYLALINILEKKSPSNEPPWTGKKIQNRMSTHNMFPQYNISIMPSKDFILDLLLFVRL